MKTLFGEARQTLFPAVLTHFQGGVGSIESRGLGIVRYSMPIAFPARIALTIASVRFQHIGREGQ